MLRTPALQLGVTVTELAYPLIPEHSALRAKDKLRSVWFLVRAFAGFRRAHGNAVAVVSEGALMVGWPAVLAARIVFAAAASYVPLVDSFLMLGYGGAERATRLFHRWYRHVPTVWITLSAGQAENLKAWGRVRQPVLTLRNAVANRFERLADQSAGPVRSASPFKIFVVGRLSARQKGLDLLLDGLKDRAEALRALDLRVVMVGDGEYREVVEASIAAEPRLAAVLELRPWSDPLACYLEADCLLLASRFEGVPLVLLEGMAAGVPVVATRLPGCRGLIGPEWLYDVGDMQAAIDRVLRLKDPGLRRRVIDENRARFREVASSNAFARNVQAMTTSLSRLGNGQPG